MKPSNRSKEKLQNLILYIANALPEPQNMYKVLKVIYFADKDHLFNYGRFVSDDDHVALQHGPVPSKAYNMVKNVKLLHSLSDDGADGAPFTVKSDNTILSLAKPDISLFSKSDLECLDKEIDICRPMTFQQLKTRSHDAAYEAAGENDFIPIESIASMEPSGNANALLDYLKTHCVHC